MHYSCGRCGFATEHLGKFRAHCQRSTLCPATQADIPIDYEAFVQACRPKTGHTCSVCSKDFATCQSLCVHKKKCVERAAALAASNASVATNTASPSSVGDHNTINNTMDNSVDNSVHNHNHITNVTINLPTNNFGEETIQHILQDLPFLTQCTRNAVKNGILNLVRKIHFDHEHPENQTARLKSIKRNLLEVINNGAWAVVDKNDTLDTMLRKAYKILGAHYKAEMEDADHDSDADEDERMEKGPVGKLLDRVRKTETDKAVYYSVMRQMFAMLVEERTRTDA